MLLSVRLAAARRKEGAAVAEAEAASLVPPHVLTRDPQAA